MVSQPKIGVLALQGCVRPHQFHIEASNANYLEVRNKRDLRGIDALILPGGESTTMLTLIEVFELREALAQTFARIPIWGICAGAILMARQVQSPKQESFGLIDMRVKRNGYGSQIDSFEFQIRGSPVACIRAPVIEETGVNVKVEADYLGFPVWVIYGHYMATTFHPELNRNQPSSIHRHFIDWVRNFR